MSTRAKKSTAKALTGRQIEHLLYGWCLGGCREHPVFPFESEEHRCQCWFDNRDWILSMEGVERIPGVFGAFPVRKGRKPAAMEQYERKSRTRRTKRGGTI